MSGLDEQDRQQLNQAFAYLLEEQDRAYALLAEKIEALERGREHDLRCLINVAKRLAAHEGPDPASPIRQRSRRYRHLRAVA